MTDFKQTILITSLATILFQTSLVRAEISGESKNLAYCSGVYLYTAHYLQMLGNDGAARNTLSRAARVQVAFMIINAEKDSQGDVIKASKISEYEDAKKLIKPLHLRIH